MAGDAVLSPDDVTYLRTRELCESFLVVCRCELGT